MSAKSFHINQIPTPDPTSTGRKWAQGGGGERPPENLAVFGPGRRSSVTPAAPGSLPSKSSLQEGEAGAAASPCVRAGPVGVIEPGTSVGPPVLSLTDALTKWRAVAVGRPEGHFGRGDRGP